MINTKKYMSLTTSHQNLFEFFSHLFIFLCILLLSLFCIYSVKYVIVPDVSLSFWWCIMLTATCVGFTGRTHAWKAKGKKKKVYYLPTFQLAIYSSLKHIHPSSFKGFSFFAKTKKFNRMRGNDEYVNNSGNINK